MSPSLPALLFLVSASFTLAQPPRDPRPGKEGRPERPGQQRYSLEQACSDRAQLHTLAFSALAFLTGDAGSASFIPPGKVADVFGFQFMRDIDAAGKGHNPMFLDRICGNVLRILSESQRQTLATAAAEEAVQLEALARHRLPLVAAFHQVRDGNPPAGRVSLDRGAVVTYVGDLFEKDARLALHRAQVFGTLARSLSEAQKQALGRLRFGDFRTWPDVDREALRNLRPRGASRLESVAYMTLASECFSWMAGSVEADTYFCPERHATYFGGFYFKDLPAMGQRDFDISTALTGDAGEAFLLVLNADQRERMTALLERQRPLLRDMVTVRRTMATLLRPCLDGRTPDRAGILALGRRYGQLDGELAFACAQAFTAIGRSLSPAQKAQLQALRAQPVEERGSAFLYSDRIPMPRWPDTAFLFSAGPAGP